jgi:flagellar basal body-associated protein FliL
MEENNAGTGGGNKGMMLVIMGMLGLIIVALAAVSVILIINIGNLGGSGNGEGGYVPPPPALTAADQILFTVGTAITTNLAQSPDGSQHIIRLEVALGINNLEPEVATEFINEIITPREMVIQDHVNTILRRTTAADLQREGGMDILREDILASLQQAFGSPMIVNVFLTDFISRIQ